MDMDNFGNNKMWPTDEGQLYKAILQLKTTGECFSFFRDLCTPEEIKVMKERWRLVQLLDNEKEPLSYREISAKTGASITTIGRVSRFLKQENYGGYRLILNRQRELKQEGNGNAA